MGQGKEVGKDVVSELVQAQPDLLAYFRVERQKLCCSEARGLGCCTHPPHPYHTHLVTHWPWAAPGMAGQSLLVRGLPLGRARLGRRGQTLAISH